MRKIIGSGLGVLAILGGVILQWPGKALEILEHALTLFGLPKLYDEFLGWIAEHPHLVLDIAPWAMIGGGLGSLVALHAGPQIWERIRDRSLEILFDPDDPQFVREKTEAGPEGPEPVIRFYVGMHNARRDHKTILWANMRAHESEFTKKVLRPIHTRKPLSGRDLMLVTDIMLDAGATHFEELFGISNPTEAEKEPLWDQTYRFALDARGRDVRTEIAEFEFNARKQPMLKRIR
jgi:hypothetical protein